MEIDYKAIGQRIKKTKVSLPTLIAIANALSVSVDTLLCDNVLTSKVIFEGEAKEVLKDCDEYLSLMAIMKLCHYLLNQNWSIIKFR